MRLPLCGTDALLARKTPGSALREMVTRSSLSIPSAEGTLNETIGPS